ncbi:2OG-Fe(II) oxygenase [Solilutibacter silvestris]|uniref:2OG-Fe(II) oxygenase n=1 Tax=Solilutibacter silvestris TaxID=1645665 RepID=UPI003D3477AA
MADAIADALCNGGACVIDGLFADLADDLAAEARSLQQRDALQSARIGRGASRQGDASVRGDSTLWLDDPACIAGPRLLQRLDTLADGLRESLRLPIRSVEAHYAHYPVGASYARHRDRFRDSGSRLVSWVGYLNRDWRAEDGGELRIHFDDGSREDVLPMFGTSVCFLSELEHEVLPARRDRYSIAAWFRRD